MPEPMVIELNDKQEYQRILGGTEKEPKTFGMRAGRSYIKPGGECGLHNTGDAEEVLVFLSGSGQLLIKDRPALAVEKGKAAYIPPNTDHNVKNTDTEPLVYVYCVAPV